MSGNRTNGIRNFIAGTMFGYGGSSFLCFFLLQTYWFDHAPRIANAASGLIFPHNEHGGIVYFSAFQATSCALLAASSVPLIFLSMLVLPKRNMETKSRFVVLGRVTWEGNDPLHMGKPGRIVGFLMPPFLIFSVGSPFIHWLNSLGFILNP